MNQLQVVFLNRKVLASPDRRYRIMVNLVRADRPRYWNFLCVNCGSKVGEVVNREVLDMSDFYDITNKDNSGIVKHCKGTLPDGLPCPYSYFFNVH